MRKRKVLFAVISSLSLLWASQVAVAEGKGYRSFNSASLIHKDGSFWELHGAIPTQLHGLTDVKASFYDGWSRKQDGSLWYRSFILKQDGSVWYWEKEQDSTRVTVYPVSGLRNLVDIVSYVWAFALDSEGNVYELPKSDDGIVTAQLSDLSPVAGIDNVAKIANHHNFFLFLKRDGSLWAQNKTRQFERLAVEGNVVDVHNNAFVTEDGKAWLIGEQSIIPLPGLQNVQVIRYNWNGPSLAIDKQGGLWFWGATYTGWSDAVSVHEHPDPFLLKGVQHVKDAFILENTLFVLTDEGDLYKTSVRREKMAEDTPFELLSSDINETKVGMRHFIAEKTDGSLWGWGVGYTISLERGLYKMLHDGLEPVLPPVPVVLNGQSVPLQQGVVIRDSRSYIPLRAIFEQMGAELTWDHESKVVTIRQSSEAGGQSIHLQIDYRTGEVTLNDVPVPLQEAPFIINGISYLPLRFTSEALGAKVDWSEAENTISIEFQRDGSQ